MLTKKQHELLLFIADRLNDTGVSPSFDEMKDALNLRSKSGIHRLISGLEERGFIRRLPHRARALEVTRMPEDLGPTGLPEPASNVVRGDFRGGPRPAVIDEDGATLQLPLFGRIAAGTPIEALREPDRFADVPATMLGGGEHYALEVDGDSMIEAGIHDGDTVIIRKCENAENGAIVVALIEDTEVTLKRLRRKGESIALEPANTAYKTRIFGPGQVKVQGRLVGLLRRY